MDPTKIAEFSDSLSRCMESEKFLDRFYELFVGSSAEVAEKFKETDFDKQKLALSSSLYMMVMAAQGGDAALAYLDKIALSHARDALDIRPELYDVWLDCLLQAASENDPDYCELTEDGWRETMGFGIRVMRERY